MSADSPRLSVIVPCHNAARWLPRCLDGLLNQRFQNIEVICVDDGSTDESPEALARYARLDGRVRVVTRPNGGVSAARNTGLKEARAPFITFADTDDLVRPEVYTLAMELLAANEDLDLTVWRYDRVAEAEDGEMIVLKTGCGGRSGLTGQHPLNEGDGFFQDVMVWNKIFKADLIRRHQISFPEGQLHEDLAFCWQYFHRARSAWYLPESLTFYSETQGSLTSHYVSRPERKLELFEVIDFVLESFQKDSTLSDADLLRASELIVTGKYLMEIPPALRPEYLKKARALAQKYDLPDTGDGYLTNLKEGRRNPAGLSFWTRRIFNKRKDRDYAYFYLFGWRVLRLRRKHSSAS